MMNKIFKILIVAVLALSTFGCFQGAPKKKPPIHLIKNMDTQGKVKPYRASNLFENGSGMRMPVEGTVARGLLKDDEAYYFGKTSTGDFVKKSPVTFTTAVLNRGQDRFNIFCVPCHGELGDGKGPITNYKYPIPPTSYHDDRLRNVPDGELFNVVSNGIRNMPSHKEQIPVPDRWAIVAYVRALQRSQNAKLTDIPANQQQNIK